MLKKLDLQKSVGTVVAVAALAGVFGVHAAVGNYSSDADAVAYSVTVEGRDDAASRSDMRAVRVTNAQQMLADSVQAAHQEAADFDHYRVENIGIANGTLKKDTLCKLSWTNRSYARCDAVNSFERLNEAFKAQFGYDIYINDSYRSYEKQVRVRKQVGKLAAVPGYSNHGLGVALDLGSGISDADSEQHQWMVEHAGDFGWVNPDWARPGTDAFKKNEPWHWEFVGLKA